MDHKIGADWQQKIDIDFSMKIPEETDFHLSRYVNK